ncbi:hypothetical protein J2W48_002633 [Flavobacterium piscis]|uniref:Uncharacterized protein n=1 Tax=Flavobacterium piscis TaxID=1114874 RepID=A0ABU1Y8X1_9FLAO|nr:hypothetical protein [Flavobacterium piscis]MDR7210683.1 hypothetical protein [Flavobacterium piscis]
MYILGLREDPIAIRFVISECSISSTCLPDKLKIKILSIVAESSTLRLKVDVDGFEYNAICLAS